MINHTKNIMVYFSCSPYNIINDIIQRNR